MVRDRGVFVGLSVPHIYLFVGAEDALPDRSYIPRYNSFSRPGRALTAPTRQQAGKRCIPWERRERGALVNTLNVGPVREQAKHIAKNGILLFDVGSSCH